MCFAYQSISQQIVQVEGVIQRLSEDMSHFDKSLADFYHELEAKQFNASEGYYIAKNLQDILFKRRKVKFEMHQARSLLTHLINVDKRLKQNEKKFIKDNPKNWAKVVNT